MSSFLYIDFLLKFSILVLANLSSKQCPGFENPLFILRKRIEQNDLIATLERKTKCSPPFFQDFHSSIIEIRRQEQSKLKCNVQSCGRHKKDIATAEKLNYLVIDLF
jgi:hypothetical protein